MTSAAFSDGDGAAASADTGGPWWVGIAHPPCAGWADRVVACLIDVVAGLPGIALALLGVQMQRNYGVVLHGHHDVDAETAGTALLITGVAVFLAIGVYNRWIRGGNGRSWGKANRGIRLVHAETGCPVGFRHAALRDLAHVLDKITWIGFLWPLWDRHRQTFADKIAHTIVVVDR